MKRVLTPLGTETPQEYDVEAGSGDSLDASKVPNHRTLQDELDELNDCQYTDWQRWAGSEHDIIPHTDAAGEPYSIGDAYDGVKCAEQWRVPNPGPYLRYVKHISETWPHLRYLAHWMEVTCAPPKWKYIRHFPRNREQRSKKANVCVLDFTRGAQPRSRKYHDAIKLRIGLQAVPQTGDANQVRLLIVEDLSRDLVETLGDHYDVDPLFFLSYIGDYLFHNTRDPWVELPNLDVDLRQQPHFLLQYLRARYFATEDEFQSGERETGKWNILRRLDSDRSRKRLQGGWHDKPDASVVLTRAKTSLWIKPRKIGEPVVAILLVDPTVSSGKPVWDGYRPFERTPTMAAWRRDPDKYVDAPTRDSLYEDVIYWCQRMNDRDLERIDQDPRCVALPMYRLVIADWLTTLKYMTTQLGKIEWVFETPHWAENTDHVENVLSKLSPWRRNVGYYQSMISEATARLFPPEIRAPYHGLQAGAPDCDTEPQSPSPNSLKAGTEESGILALWVDFRNIKRQMDEIQVRINAIQNMATNNINIEESRRAVSQNKNLARLTFLASIFIPLQFTSSFLSISPDFPKAKTSIWLFFVIGVPLTLFALLCIELTHPEKKGWTWRRLNAIKSWYNKRKKIKDKTAPTVRNPTMSHVTTSDSPDIRQRRQSAAYREKQNLKRKITTVPWASSNDPRHTKHG